MLILGILYRIHSGDEASLIIRTWYMLMQEALQEA
jgi:hypothetical protein